MKIQRANLMENNKRPALFYNVVNGNGRMYTQDSMAKAVERYTDKNHPVGVQYGELGHPESVKDFRLCTNPSHMITDIESTEEGLFIQVQPCTNEDGKLLKILLSFNTIVFRPRIIGTVDESGIVHVDEIVSFDAISKSEDSYREQQKEYDEKNKK